VARLSRSRSRSHSPTSRRSANLVSGQEGGREGEKEVREWAGEELAGGKCASERAGGMQNERSSTERERQQRSTSEAARANQHERKKHERSSAVAQDKLLLATSTRSAAPSPRTSSCSLPALAQQRRGPGQALARYQHTLSSAVAQDSLLLATSTRSAAQDSPSPRPRSPLTCPPRSPRSCPS
jgi:hypothetical protein